LTRRRKKEILASLFDNYVNKPMSQMTAYEKILFLGHNMIFQKQIRRRVFVNGKEHKEIIVDKNDPTNWHYEKTSSI
jgi:hypothetical protein